MSSKEATEATIGCMPAIERTMDQARLRAQRLLREVGRELRAARITRGLSQRAVASVVEISQAQLSLIERDLYPVVTLDTLARAAAAVGLELSVKFYPGGEPIRDTAHIALLDRFRKAVGETWAWSSEVPLPVPGDKRAWDRLLRSANIAIGIEGETRPTDMQELGRRVALKKRDGGVDRVILVLANTEWCRRLVRLNDIDAAFPVPGRIALKALAEGRDPGGDAIVLI
jgi:transcriptional regulator with XRE-family HTH domain